MRRLIAGIAIGAVATTAAYEAWLVWKVLDGTMDEWHRVDGIVVGHTPTGEPIRYRP